MFGEQNALPSRKGIAAETMVSPVRDLEGGPLGSDQFARHDTSLCELGLKIGET